MAAPAAVLSILVKANTGAATTGLLRLNQTLDTTEKRSHKVARAMETVAKGVALVGAGTAVAGIVYATKKAANFEQQMSSLGAVSDATAKQMERFRKQALKAGADTKFSALEAVQAQTELAKGGLSVAQIAKGGLKSALALAAAGEMELADAAEATVNAMKLFGLRGKDAMKVADGFATAANKTTADVADFAMALKMGGSAAKASGLSFVETTAALEALAEMGIRNSDAGTSLKSALVQLAAPTEKAQTVMDKLGLSFFDAKGNMKGLTDISGMLRKRLGDLTNEQRLAAVKTIAGTDGLRALLALYDAGPKKIARFQQELGKQGTAAEVAKKKQDNLMGSLEQFQGSLETLGIQIGTGFLPVIRQAADELTGLANDIGKIVDRKDLTLGEKLQKSIDLAKVRLDPWVDKLKAAIDRADIPEKLGVALSAATPVIAKAAGQAAVIAAKSFVSGFLAADIWGRLVIGAWLLSRMGGPPAFMKIGAAGGAAMGAGMATGVAASGLKGRMVGMFKAWGPTLGLTLALAIAPSLIKKIQSIGEGAPGQPTETAGNAASQAQEIADKAGKGREGLVKAREQLVKFEADFRRIANLPGKPQSWIDYYNGIANAIRKVGEPIREKIKDFQAVDGRVRQMSDNIARSLHNMNVKGKDSFDGLVRGVLVGSRAMLRVGGKNSEATQQAIGRQFDIARKRVQQAMDRKVLSVKRGTEMLHTLAVKELALYGISAGRVNVVLAKGANGQMRPHARGGPITEGKAHGDSVPALLERGEYVVNRKAVNKVGRKALDRLNFGTAPRFQAGGMIDPAWDPGNERLAGSISGRVGAWAKRYNANMTAGYDPGGGHVSPGHNITGTATDMVPLAGDWDLLEKGLRVLVNAGLKVLYGSNGVGTAWPNHGRGNHAHIEWGAGGGALPSLFQGLPRVMLKGPASVGLEAGQGALDRVRSAADAAINKVAGFSGETSESGFGFSGKWTEVMANIAKSRGWNLSDWRRLVQGESGGDPTARNKSSGAYGLGQFLGRTAEQYAKYGALSSNPVDQIRAMAQYISDRYGNPSEALAFWLSHDPHWYSQGGMVGMAAGGLAGGVSKALKKVGKHPRRHAPVKRLLDRISKAGLSDATTKRLGELSKNSDIYGEYASRAEQLGVDGVGGMVGGLTQEQWLVKELEALFQWRNALIRAHEEAVAKRAKVIQAVTYARMAQGSLKTRIAVLARHPKKNRAMLRPLRAQYSALGKLIPALTGKRSALTTARGDILSSLETVQGLGAPSGVLKTLPAIGVLGGRIFDTQLALQGLRTPATVTDTDTGTGETSERDSLLAQLLREANLRTAVSEAQFKVFKEMPQFATGGIVQGPTGAATPAVVHAGEGVFTRDQMAAMGGTGTVVNVNVAPGMEWLKQFINVQVEQNTRKQSRNAGRALPGRGGGGLRG